MFAAETIQGRIALREWLGEKFGILFSHQQDFTLARMTELGELAKIELDAQGSAGGTRFLVACSNP
jgi:thioredoxin-dependent peroxiredoxin